MEGFSDFSDICAHQYFEKPDFFMPEILLKEICKKEGGEGTEEKAGERGEEEIGRGTEETHGRTEKN